MVAIEVVPYDAQWPEQFDAVAGELRDALSAVPSARIEHVGSTSVPGLAAKPILDIDVIVAEGDVGLAVAALGRVGYEHRGDLGVTGREAFHPPDSSPRRNVYVCTTDTLHVRNHLAVREVLGSQPALRDAYAAVKQQLAHDPTMDIDTYIARKTAVLHDVLAESDLTEAERAEIARLNDPSR